MDLYAILGAILVIGLIMTIVNGAFRNFSYKAKGIALTITSILFAIIFSIILFVDKKYDLSKIPLRFYIYFIGVSLLAFFSVALPTLIKGIKFGYGNRKQKMIYTYHKKEEHVYLIYKYQSYIYLKKDSNTGIDYELKSNEFTDDVLSKLNNKYNIELERDYDRMGMITVKGEKIDKIYYCYLIEIKNPLNNEKLKSLNLYDIGNVEIEELDKFIILNTLMGEYFEITK